MSAGAPQEDVLGEGELALDEVLQPQQEREEAGEQEEDDGVEEEEDEAPTHLLFAPSKVRAPFSSLAQVHLLWRWECRLGRAFRRAVGERRVASGYGGTVAADLLLNVFGLLLFY